MEKVNIIVNCLNCGEDIVHTLSDTDKDVSVHIGDFEDCWECLKCGQTTVLSGLRGGEAKK